jgi:hypothetical protein
MKDLSDKHSGVYINKVLLEALKEFDIEYHITRYILILILIFKS